MKHWIVAACLSFALSFSAFAADVKLVRIASMPESKIVTKVRPVYPADAADLRIHGVVRINVVIGADGRVESARLLSGHPLLAPSALQAVRHWVFEPTEVDAKPVRVATVIDIPFDLDAYGRSLTRK